MSFALTPFPVYVGIDRFSALIHGLVQALVSRNSAGRMSDVMFRLIVERVGRIGREVRTLALALRDGPLQERRSAAPGLRRQRSGQAPAVLLPRGFGWLVVLMPSTAACLGGQLLATLDEPEMKSLLAASPRAVRAIRPLCRMLGVTMPEVARPVAAPAAAPPDVDRVAPRARAVPVGFEGVEDGASAALPLLAVTDLGGRFENSGLT